MHIVHLTNAYSPRSGGVRTTAHALGRGYRERGHDLTLVVPGPQAREGAHVWGTLVQLRGPAVPGTGGYRALLDRDALRRTLDRLAPDRLEVSDRFTMRHLGGWARSAGVPAVLLAHERLDGILRTTGHLPAPLARAAADRHNRGTAAAFPTVVATTRFAAQEFDRIGVATTLVPLGVDLVEFQPGGPAGRAEDGHGAGPMPVPVLVLCSRLSPEKRPDLAVEALRLLVADGTSARLVVAGDGPAMAGLRRRASGLPVTFLGHVPDRRAVAELLAGADVVLAPGPIETLGLAALEALACGTPVVASRTSALAELLTDGSGACAEPTARGVAAAVATLLAQPAAHGRRAARERAEQFPWSRTVDAMLAVHTAPTAGAVR
ncbi:GDP-mannose-dependent alpha-(1-6)-phosphatidylinositol dimannoside mannosyltransferase [Actinomycetota bacterium]|nr:GDP-mannose-dependent alpha-(1-6)-phosphatidylinositol dimannoside mannosyltransferase [Actinomycetota bacterium]